MIIVYIFLVIMLIWIAWITYVIWGIRKNYLTFTDGINKKNLDVILTSLVHGQQKSKEDIAKLVARCVKIEKDGKYHIQKVGLLRFNPFKDTGGDQSFILALVDAHDTGIILTALYSRSGTRWYTKRVLNGEGTELQLSEEEKKAIRVSSELK